MSLLIKALKKAEQSKDAKADSNPDSGRLTLELTPIEEKPQENAPSLAEEAGLSQPEKVVSASAPPETIPSNDIAEPEPPAASTEPAIANAVAEDDIAAALMEESGFSLNDEAGFSNSSPVKTPKPAAATKTEKPLKPIKNAAPEPVPEKPAASAPVSAAASADEQRSVAIGLLTTRNDKKLSPGNRRSLYLGLAGLILLLGLGGGFYYYLQTLDQTQMVLMQPVPKRPLPPVAASAPVSSAPKATAVVAQAVASPALPGTAAAPLNVEPSKPADKSATAPEPSAEPLTQIAAAKPAPIQKPDSSTAPLSARSSRKPMAMHHQETTDQDPAMKVSRLNRGGPTIDPAQLAAYQAYQAGDDVAAHRLYGKLLQNDPRNVEALLGAAAVAARQEHSSEAANYYQRVLELDPHNEAAQEGLILLSGEAKPTEAESRLKTLIIQQPGAAHLQASLGEIYTDQNRWPDAQQAYFKAFNLDPDNADYAFNLAVSLDQLKKPGLALNYYQQALTLLNKHGGSVDKAALQNRINQLRADTAN